jgi:hypothetical protein
MKFQAEAEDMSLVQLGSGAITPQLMFNRRPFLVVTGYTSGTSDKVWILTGVFTRSIVGVISSQTLFVESWYGKRGGKIRLGNNFGGDKDSAFRKFNEKLREGYNVEQAFALRTIEDMCREFCPGTPIVGGTKVQKPRSLLLDGNGSTLFEVPVNVAEQFRNVIDKDHEGISSYVKNLRVGAS